MKRVPSSLHKREILRGYRTFSKVIAEGRSLQRGVMRCFFVAESERRTGTRVGFAVSRGVRNAVERNRARRWMKEAFRRNKSILSEPPLLMVPSISLVFMLRSRGTLDRGHDFRRAIDQSIISLLKDLHHKLLEEP